MEYRTEAQWSFEQANAEQNDLYSHPTYNLDSAGLRQPLPRWFAMRRLDGYEKEFNTRANGFPLLAAIRSCATYGIVMPEWLARAYCSRYDRVLNCETKSWDVAFDHPYPEGKHINAIRKKRESRTAVWLNARKILAENPDTAIDKAFFEAVGKSLRKPIGSTLAEELYYEEKREFKRALGYDIGPPSPVGKAGARFGTGKK